MKISGNEPYFYNLVEYFYFRCFVGLDKKKYFTLGFTFLSNKILTFTIVGHIANQFIIVSILCSFLIFGLHILGR